MANRQPSPCFWALWLGLWLAILLSGCSGDSQPRLFPETGKSLQGAYLRFWEAHDGQTTFGAPLSAPLWIDGHEVQFFERGRLDSNPGWLTTTIDGTQTDAGWERNQIIGLFDLEAADQRADFATAPTGAPLEPITSTLRIEGYSGPAEIRIFDSQNQPFETLTVTLQDGSASIITNGRGVLGTHPALALIDGKLAGATSNLFTLDATTSIQTGQPRFDRLYDQVRGFMEQDVTEYAIDGIPVRGYRSPDNTLLWLRDHVYQARAFRYFEQDMTSLLDAFRRAQRDDGSFPDYLSDPEHGIPAQRMDVEADLEYLFVQGVYEAWQATGDDAWMRQNLETMRRGLHYTMSDPQRWDATHQLVKRPYTIDTWDFAYGPTTTDPLTGRPAPRHWIDDQTVWGIFHGDNTGLAHALRLLATMEEHGGDPDLAAQWREDANGIMERLNALSWNGHFYTHFVPLEPFTVPGVDTAQQLSLSNALALNRDVLSFDQHRAIVDEYWQRAQNRGESFAEWYSIDPPFPAGSYGLDGRAGELPGEYVNGGIMPLVGGELARGAFEAGTERYAFNILDRYSEIISITNKSYLWYHPDGRPGISGYDTIPTDGWGSSAMFGALIEGAAGITDLDVAYRIASISPRWAFTDDVREARVVARYAASEGYIAYHWRSDASETTLEITGSGKELRLRIPLDGKQTPRSVTVDGQEQTFKIDNIEGSRYLKLTVQRGSAVVQLRY